MGKPTASINTQGLPADKFFDVRDLSAVGQVGKFTSVELAEYWGVANFFLVHWAAFTTVLGLIYAIIFPAEPIFYYSTVGLFIGWVLHTCIFLYTNRFAYFFRYYSAENVQVAQMALPTTMSACFSFFFIVAGVPFKPHHIIRHVEEPQFGGEIQHPFKFGGKLPGVAEYEKCSGICDTLVEKKVPQLSNPQSLPQAAEGSVLGPEAVSGRNKSVNLEVEKKFFVKSKQANVPTPTPKGPRVPFPITYDAVLEIDNKPATPLYWKTRNSMPDTPLY
jgi:hypothetical protein